MKEVAITEDSNLFFGKDNVWMSRKGGNVFPVAESFVIECYPKSLLNRCILTLDS